MVQYPQGDSRPDFIYGLSACACFVHSQSRYHEIELERIWHHLKGTPEEGLILRSSEELDVDIY